MDDGRTDFALAVYGKTAAMAHQDRGRGSVVSAHDVIWGVDVIVRRVVAATRALMKGAEVTAAGGNPLKDEEVTPRSDSLPMADDDVIEAVEIRSMCDDIVVSNEVSENCDVTTALHKRSALDDAMTALPESHTTIIQQPAGDHQ